MTLVINDTKHDSWSNIDWAKVNKIVNNLQQRIFVAKQQGNLRKVRKLQNLLLSSKANKLLAVRQVCSINSGSNTSGIDKRVYATPKERMDLALKLYEIPLNTWKPAPVKRIYIRKSNGKLRPLGIPTLIDRSLQAIVRNALEPEWEATFEPSSYGFRKGRSAHDAIAYLHNVCNSKSSKHWVLNADIKGCFDNISHKLLLNQLSNFPAKKLISNWLKAGYVDNRVFHDSSMGTPQGGVISPLLANIALNGMEEAIGIKRSKRGDVKSDYTLIRYADDFIIACKSKESAIEIKETVNNWLKLRGLSLSPDKTRIVHVKDGFDFLGFNVRLYASKNSNKLLIKPSLESQIKIRKKLKKAWKESLGSPDKKAINKMNLILKGWANYYRIGVSSRIFAKIDYYNWIRQYRFAKRTHPKKPWKWIKAKYWGKLCPNRNDKWVFGCPEIGNFMYKLSWTPIKRHIMVKGNNSPFDPNLQEYWNKRNITTYSKTIATTSSMKIAKKQ
jgi:RNA-directed DNA polymerase